MDPEESSWGYDSSDGPAAVLRCDEDDKCCCCLTRRCHVPCAWICPCTLPCCCCILALNIIAASVLYVFVLLLFMLMWITFPFMCIFRCTLFQRSSVLR